MNASKIAEKIADTVTFDGKNFLMQADRDACVEAVTKILINEGYYNGPRRRWELTLRVSADTKERLLSELDHFTGELGVGKEGAIMGGCDSGGWYKLTVDEGMNHDKFVEQLKAWQATKKEKHSHVHNS